MIVFPTHAAYEPFTPLYRGQSRRNVVGHAVSAPTVNYLVLTIEGDPDLRVIYHEYVHILLNATMAGAPAWFQEGLAEFYSTFQATEDGRAQIGNVLRDHVLRLRHEPLLPLATLVTVDHDSPLYNEQDKASMFYAESWALVHYLLLGDGARDDTRLARFVSRLADGVPLARACAEVLQTTPETLQQDLLRYLHADAFVRQVVPVTSSEPVDTLSDVGRVPPAEAHTALGDVLHLMRRSAEAEAQLAVALARDPDFAPAHAAMGQVLLALGRPADARAHLVRAIGSPSATWVTHFTYAAVLIEQRQPLATDAPAPEDPVIERALRRAMALNPDAAEPYGRLAWLKAQVSATLPEADALIREGLARAPGNESLGLVRAIVLAKQGQGTTRRDRCWRGWREPATPTSGGRQPISPREWRRSSPQPSDARRRMSGSRRRRAARTRRARWSSVRSVRASDGPRAGSPRSSAQRPA